MTVQSVAEKMGMDPMDAFFKILRMTQLRCSAIFFDMCEENLERILRWPFVSIGSDSSARALEGETAQGKPHRSCAARCISGGIPPVLLVKDPDGNSNHLLLVSADGRTVNQQVLPLVAEPVEITGRVMRLGGQLVLQANPETYRRLPG